MSLVIARQGLCTIYCLTYLYASLRTQYQVGESAASTGFLRCYKANGRVVDVRLTAITWYWWCLTYHYYATLRTQNQGGRPLRQALQKNRFPEVLKANGRIEEVRLTVDTAAA